MSSRLGGKRFKASTDISVWTLLLKSRLRTQAYLDTNADEKCFYAIHCFSVSLPLYQAGSSILNMRCFSSPAFCLPGSKVPASGGTALSKSRLWEGNSQACRCRYPWAVPLSMAIPAFGGHSELYIQPPPRTSFSFPLRLDCNCQNHLKTSLPRQ